MLSVTFKTRSESTENCLNKDQCFGCGQNHHQDKSECPAFGKPAISVVGAITLCLYVAKFLTGDPCSDLSHEEDRHWLMN